MAEEPRKPIVERRKVSRPQPPMQDKRTKRQRTRQAQKDAARKDDE